MTWTTNKPTEPGWYLGYSCYDMIHLMEKVTINLPPEQVAILRTHALDLDISLDEMIRRIIAATIERYSE